MNLLESVENEYIRTDELNFGVGDGKMNKSLLDIGGEISFE